MWWSSHWGDHFFYPRYINWAFLRDYYVFLVLIPRDFTNFSPPKNIRMKKIFTLVAAIALAFSVEAQYKVAPGVEQIPAISRLATTPIHVTTVDHSQTDRGDFLWSDDFSNPATWVTQSLYGNFGWEITSDELGWFFADPISSLSGGNYAFVWNDNPIDNPTPDPGEYNLTTADPINVSGFDAALLVYNVYGARFTDQFNVQVSTDGVNFATVGDHSDIVMLTANGGAPTDNSELRQYNITLNVQNEDFIWIRFNWLGDIAYGWMIDDVRLVAPAEHDVQIAEMWTGDIIFDFEYTMIPQAQSTQNKVVGASFRNFGGNAEQTSLDVTITRNGEVNPVYTGISDPITSFPGALDTIWFDTGFVPGDVDEYTVEIEVVNADGDENPDDNTLSKNFMVTENIWANDRYDALTATWNGTLGAGTSTASEYIMATAFAVYEPGTNFELCQFRLASGTGLGQEIEIALYIFGESEIEPVTESFTYYTLVAGDLSDWLNVAAEDPIELEVGQTYLMTIHHFSQDPPLVIRGSEGDNDISTYVYGPYGANNALGWYFYTDFSPAIRLGLDGSIGVPTLSNEEMLNLMQNMPNPFQGVTTVPYSLNEAARVTVDVYDITGKQVLSFDEGMRSAGEHRLEINASSLAKGVYTYTLRAGDVVKTRKMTVQ